MCFLHHAAMWSLLNCSRSRRLRHTGARPGGAVSNVCRWGRPRSSRAGRVTGHSGVLFLVPDLKAGLPATIGTPDLSSVWCDPTPPVSIEPYEYQPLEKPNGQPGELLKGRDVSVIVVGPVSLRPAASPASPAT